jgi:hypothetical protein
MLSLTKARDRSYCRGSALQPLLDPGRSEDGGMRPFICTQVTRLPVVANCVPRSRRAAQGALVARRSSTLWRAAGAEERRFCSLRNRTKPWPGGETRRRKRGLADPRLGEMAARGITTRLPLPDGRASNVTEVFSAVRRFIALLTIERTTGRT